MIFPTTIGSMASSTKFIWEQLGLLDGSMSFSGASNSYVSIANQTSIQLSSNFTIEWWMKLDSTGTGNNPRVFSYGTWSVNPDIDFAVEISNKTTLGVWWQDSFRTFGSITQNEWGHYVVVGSGGSSIKVYKNGVQLGTTWSINTTVATNKNLSIGNETSPSTAGAFKGQISNFHIVKGSAIYQGVVVPIAPIYPDANSTVLMLASDSNNVGTNSVGFATPILNNISWSSVVPEIENPMKTLSLSSSVEITSNTYVGDLTDFVLGTGDFTIEWYQYLNGEGGRAFDYINNTSSQIYYESNATQEWTLYRLSVNPTRTGNFRNQIGKWVHLAIERWNGNLYYYQNGRLVSYRDMTYNLSSITDFYIGSGAGGLVDGYLSNFHIVKGTTVYTEPYFNANGSVGDFTPPTTDLTPNANSIGLYFKSGNTTSDTSGAGNNLTSFGGVSNVSFNAKTMP